MSLFAGIPEPEPTRVIAWFSSGAASAVMTMLAKTEYPALKVVNIVIGTELKDAGRFTNDCEKWLGIPIERLIHPKFPGGHLDVIRSVRYIRGVAGAPCSRILKREVREKYQRPGDLHLFGFDADEASRVEDFRENNPGLLFRAPLIEAGLTKSDCHRIIERAGIEAHEMYRKGYANGNCVGCVKGGIGYWNRIRTDFPLFFGEMGRVEREVGHSILRHRSGPLKGQPMYLDELNPNAGRFDEDQPGECGELCQVALEKVGLA